MSGAEESAETPIYAWIQAVCCVVAAGIAIVSYSPRTEPAAIAEPTPAVQAELEVVLLDESVDPLADQVEPQLPTGVALFTETAGFVNERRHYARLVLQRDESVAQGLTRLEPWLATLRLPHGARFGWQRQDTGQFRSYLLTGPAVFTARDVSTAEVVLNPDGRSAVSIRLHSGATEIVRQFTRAHQGQAMALIVNGLIVTAPRIRAEISNGMMQITLGGDTPETTRESAEAFIKELKTPARY
jgi:hypothetical protein